MRLRYVVLPLLGFLAFRGLRDGWFTQVVESVQAIGTYAAPAGGEYDVEVLTDSTGRELECEIVGKRDGVLAVRRVPDLTPFPIQLSTLSLEDQKRFEATPNFGDDDIIRFSSARRNRSARWHGTESMAKAEAQRTGLPIYMLFTRDSSNFGSGRG